MTAITDRLEYLRSEIRAERISWSELADLQTLAEHIEAGDVELLEWAGVPDVVAHGVEPPDNNLTQVLTTRHHL